LNGTDWIANTYLWHLDLVSFLEVLGEGLDEVSGWDIFDSGTVVGVENSELNLKERVLGKECLLLTSIFVIGISSVY
tara:strand:- start:520 stop:750 length:231 start_codon:yes stop_codon:yes gene_type:complete